ncbi:hypothetical protein OIDMADRAFT_165317 [Oidiodendron maius Zn]|uniref:NADH:flavin oxidoreductase/NADH oxidase N-terminal domain-containing protein n=1 Tax=Oidiodendron maius (strain Zn) TaxID=913774 RepID=A0A0C3DFE3_OIDMZ|nr:hypothetical protein OIDMADRAFT_165317 [Oidiodendron maius Zn]
MAQHNLNTPVPGISYFTPQHLHSPGTPKEVSSKTPTLFRPLRIRSVTLRNRIIVSPMCQYSSASSGPNIGTLTDWHVATLGHYAIKGAALVFVEATAVQPNGRISPNCPGLWDDAQIEGLKRVADFVKSQDALIGVQLAHAGRKSKIGEVIHDFAMAAERSVEAGVDVIEIHAAHGYLLHQFLSPISNHRTDEYGGSFENRTRLLFEVVKAVRDVIPPVMPLFLRISSTDVMEDTDLGKKLGSWDVESTINIARQIPALGVDLLDVSSGGNHPGQRLDGVNTKDYHVNIAGRIRDAIHSDNLELLIGVVGMITTAEQAREIVEQGANSPEEGSEAEGEAAKDVVFDKNTRQAMADVVLVARQFLREPDWVLRVASKLGVDVWWPNQFMRI